MTLMALAIALVLIVVAIVLVVRGVQRRMVDERQSVQGYQRALETLRHVSEQHTSPLAVRPQTPSSLEKAPLLAPEVHGLAGPEPARPEPQLQAAVVAWDPGDLVPEAAHVVHELVSGRSLIGQQPSRRPLTPLRRRSALGGAVWALAAAAVIVTVAAVAYALIPGSPSSSAGHASHHVTHPAFKPSSVTSDVPTTLAPTTSTAYTATYQLPASEDQVVLAANGTCWVEATNPATGAVLWTGTMLAGQTHSFSALATMRLRLGAAENVSMSVGRTPVVLPSGFGSPFDVTFQVA